LPSNQCGTDEHADADPKRSRPMAAGGKKRRLGSLRDAYREFAQRCDAAILIGFDAGGLLICGVGVDFFETTLPPFRTPTGARSALPNVTRCIAHFGQRARDSSQLSKWRP
jgi:hypothetical protein